MPFLPEENWFSAPPDWVCEALSPHTIRTDRMRKMPIYAEYGVGHLWFVDPHAKTLEVFRQEGESWFLVSVHGGTDKVGAEPFREATIDLALLFRP